MTIEFNRKKDVLQEDNILETPEIRVWYYSEKTGEDTYLAFKSIPLALEFIRINKVNPNIKTEDLPLIAINGYEYDLFTMKEVDK